MKTRELQRTLYRAAKRSRTRRFHALYDRMYQDEVLRRAWEEVRENKGMGGVDAVTIADIEARGVTGFLNELKEALRAKRYHAKPVLRVYIPKADGAKRPLGIPTVRDRVVQQACKIVIEPIFEATFEDCSYGYRPKRTAQQAKDRVEKALRSGWHVLDADIQKYFDTIDHEILLGLVARRVSDRRILKLIRQWLKSGVVENGQKVATECGTPQGGVISPLLANIYLHVVDRFWEQECAHLGTLVRYADDFVIITRERYQAQCGLDKVKSILGRLKLKLNEGKTKIVKPSEQGFTFLGFYFYKSKTRKTGKLLPYVQASKESMKKVAGKIRTVVNIRNVKLGLEEIVKRVNPIIRGWRNYFKTGNCTRQFKILDKLVYTRFCRIHKRKYKSNVSRCKMLCSRWYRTADVERFTK